MLFLHSVHFIPTWCLPYSYLVFVYLILTSVRLNVGTPFFKAYKLYHSSLSFLTDQNQLNGIGLAHYVKPVFIKSRAFFSKPRELVNL